LLLSWGDILGKMIFIVMYYLQNLIFVIDYFTNKNFTPMVKRQIYFGLSKSWN